MDWIHVALGNIDNIVDSRLQGEYDINFSRKALDIAMACVGLGYTYKPTMNFFGEGIKTMLVNGDGGLTIWSLSKSIHNFIWHLLW